DVAAVVGGVEVGRGVAAAVLAGVVDAEQAVLRLGAHVVGGLRVAPQLGHEREDPVGRRLGRVVVEVDGDVVVPGDQLHVLHVLEPVLHPGGRGRGEAAAV